MIAESPTNFCCRCDYGLRLFVGADRRCYHPDNEREHATIDYVNNRSLYVLRNGERTEQPAPPCHLHNSDGLCPHFEELKPQRSGTQPHRSWWQRFCDVVEGV